MTMNTFWSVEEVKVRSQPWRPLHGIVRRSAGQPERRVVARRVQAWVQQVLLVGGRVHEGLCQRVRPPRGGVCRHSSLGGCLVAQEREAGGGRHLGAVRCGPVVCAVERGGVGPDRLFQVRGVCVFVGVQGQRVGRRAEVEGAARQNGRHFGHLDLPRVPRFEGVVLECCAGRATRSGAGVGGGRLARRLGLLPALSVQLGRGHGGR